MLHNENSLLKNKTIFLDQSTTINRVMTTEQRWPVSLGYYQGQPLPLTLMF